MDTPYFWNQIDEEGRDEATELQRRSRGEIATSIYEPVPELRILVPADRCLKRCVDPPGHNGKLLLGDFETEGAAMCVSRRRSCEPDKRERRA